MEHEQIKKELEKKLAELNSNGVIFDTINYTSNQQLDTFLTNLSKEQALHCLVEACKSAYNRGSFRIEESEVLSKALRILSSE